MDSIRSRIRRKVSFLSLLGIIAACSTIQAQPGPAWVKEPVLSRPTSSAYEIRGVVREYLDSITANWLLKVPDTNPAILTMFADREAQPYKDYSPWSGEFAGKYLNGAVKILKLTNNQVLRAKIQTFVNTLVSYQDPTSGYLGPYRKADQLSGWDPTYNRYTWDLWNHMHIMMGLLEWHGVVGDTAALNCVTRIADMMCAKFLNTPTKIINTTYFNSTEMNHGLIYGMTLIYKQTGTKRYLDLANQIVAEFQLFDKSGRQGGDYVRQALAGKEFYQTPLPRWESLYPLLGVGELYFLTGKADYKTTVENFWWSIAKTDRHNNGGFSSGEGAVGNPYDTRAIETCCTVAWLALGIETLRMTGNSIIADELEMSTLNQVLGYQSRDGRWCTYNTPMDGKRVPSVEELGFQIRTGTEEISCCSANAPNGFGMIGDWGLMADSLGLILNWYGASTMSGKVGGTNVALVQSTKYPEDGIVSVAVNPEIPKTFTLKLRIPNWSIFTEVTVNGTKISGVIAGKYLSINRDWKSGDLVAVSLDMSLRYWKGEKESVGKTSIYRGPLLLVAEQKDSTRYSTVQQWGTYTDIRASNSIGSTVEYEFTGTGVTWEGKLFDDAGIAQVTIDNVLKVSVDQYGPVREKPFTWSTSGLKNTKHKMTITVQNYKHELSSGYWINVKSLRVTPVTLDANTLQGQAQVVQNDEASQLQVMVRIAKDGDTTTLRDYGTVGGRVNYTSWLPIQNTVLAAFSQDNPGRFWRPPLSLSVLRDHNPRVAFHASLDRLMPKGQKTLVTYRIANSGRISLKVADVTGRTLAVLVNGQLEAGQHQVLYDASGLPRGVYFLTLSAGSLTVSGKLTLLK